MIARLKPPAYSRDLIARRQSGQPIELLVVSVHCWNSGKHLAEALRAARIVIPPDLPPEGADLSMISGLDVLLTGEESPAFWMAVRGAFAWRAATVWVEDQDDILRLENHPSLTTMQRVPRQRFGAELVAYRERMLLCLDWPYDQPVFEPARQGLMRRLFGAAEAACTP